MAKWYLESGNESDVIVSSRVRLARNIQGFPFCKRLTAQQIAEINSRVKKALGEINDPTVRDLKYIEMKNVPEAEIYAMVERHIISPAFAGNCEGRAILLSSDESVSVMICEEDHLRIQVLRAGLNLKKAYTLAERLDTLLCEKLHFAYHTELGYLTECPTNIGTGLRASLMLHRPLLSASGAMAGLSDAVNKIGFTVRGLYGEGSSSKAALYQLSNQITLGITENDAINNLENVAHQFVSRELAERESADRVQLEDNIFRSLGILKNARLLSSEEMMELTSMIKLGASMGIIDIEKTIPMKILIECQPNMLISVSGANNANERDKLRAETVRKILEF